MWIHASVHLVNACVLKTDIETNEVVIFLTKTFKASIGVIPHKKKFKARAAKKSVPLSYDCHTEINKITILPPQNEPCEPISELRFLPQHSPPPSRTSSSWPSGTPASSTLASSPDSLGS